MTQHATPHAEFPLGPFTPYDAQPDPAPAGRRLGVGERLQPGRGREGRQGGAALPRARRRHRVARRAWPPARTASTSSGTRSRCSRRPSPTRSSAARTRGSPRSTAPTTSPTPAWDRTYAQLCLATSTDLFTWEKHGPLFPDFNTFLPAGNGVPGAVEQGRRHPGDADRRPLPDVLRRGLDLLRLVRRPDPLDAGPPGRADHGADACPARSASSSSRSARSRSSPTTA